MGKSYTGFFSPHRHVRQILGRYTRAMGRFSDVPRYDLIVTDRMGMLHPCVDNSETR